MPRVTAESKQWDYYSETTQLIEPTPEEYERGVRLVEGMKQIRQALLNSNDEYLNLQWSSLNRVRIIVYPSEPVEREVVRADSFYEYTSPHEITESVAPLVIASFALAKSIDLAIGLPAIEATGPNYRPLKDSFEVHELYHRLNLSSHKVAVRIR